MDTEAPQTLVNEQRAGPAYLSELLRQIARQSIAIAPVVFLGAILLGTPAAPRGAVVSGIVACSVASAAMLTMAFYTASLLLAVSMERNLNPEFRIPFGVGWFFYLGGLVTFLIALGLSPWLVLNPPAAMALSGFVAAVGLAMAFMLYQIGSRAEATESEQSHPSSSHSSELRDSRPK